MKIRFLSLGVFALVASSLAVFGGVEALVDPGDFIPDQSWEDSNIPNSSSNGNWSDLAGGVTGRPFVKALSLTTGGTTTDLVINGTATTAAPTAPGDITVVISPINLCKLGTKTANCYSSPNRVGVSLVYVKGSGLVGYNFSAPTVPLIRTFTNETIVDLTIGLNVVGKSLGWTWLNGTPSFWKTENLGQDTGTARVKFKLSRSPTLGAGVDYCSGIPVRKCDAAISTRDTLGGQMVLSLDETAGAAFSGALFATNEAIIGSLEIMSGTSQNGEEVAPTLSYGIAAPHSMSDNTPRKGKFYGVLSDAVLQSQFKIAATETDMTKVMSVARTAESKSTSDAGTDTVTWAKWTAADNGTDGRLVTISDISFSAPQFKVTKVVSPSKGSTRAPKAPTQGKITAKARTITATATGVAGVSYSARGVLGKVAKSGSCKLAGTKITCTIKATKAGAWRVTITPSLSGIAGPTWSGNVKVK